MNECFAELAAMLTDDTTAISALVAASDGLCTAILIENVAADVDHVHSVLSHALGTPLAG